MSKLVVLVLTLFLLLQSCADQKDPLNPVDTEALNSKQLIAFLDTVWNNKDLSAVDSFFSNTFTRRVNSVNMATSKSELTANLQVYFTGFPDLRIEAEDMVAKGNQVYVTWTLTGTNTGVYGELQATGKKVRISGISRMDFDESGKIIHEDVVYNELSLLQQMGHTLNPPVLE
jgi:steroid delta-isomerase-like uncharacterized protein